MSTITHFVAQSVDGYIEGPGGEFDWPVMGPELSAYARALGEETDAFLYGRRVWDMMSGFWPRAEEYSTDEHDLAFAPLWREKRKYVVSRALEKADWNTEVIGDDVAARIGALKESGTSMVMFGGSDLAASLTGAGLIDDYQVFVHPVVLGGGRPTFPHDEKRHGLSLVESRVFDSQVVLMRYRRA